MQRSPPPNLRAIRWLLAGWLVVLPWFTNAMPVDGERSPAGVTVAAEMPCHGEMAGAAAETAPPACIDCPGERLSTCKCCSFTTPSALPSVEVSAHLSINVGEGVFPARAAQPPSDHHDRLFRPPIRRFI